MYNVMVICYIFIWIYSNVTFSREITAPLYNRDMHFVII